MKPRNQRFAKIIASKHLNEVVNTDDAYNNSVKAVRWSRENKARKK
ncbi:hypothetical protein [Bacillus piscicola]|nr:hypothetical protein [Bacillus piscicola]